MIDPIRAELLLSTIHEMRRSCYDNAPFNNAALKLASAAVIAIQNTHDPAKRKVWGKVAIRLAHELEAIA